jgi:ABC-type transport system involved in multi-copper enzyme maturation permease subunit
MTTITPSRAAPPPGRAGFTHLLLAEWTKFRTVRGWVIALCAAVVFFVLLSCLSAFESHFRVGAVPAGPGGEAVSDTYMLVHQALAGDGTLTARAAWISGAYVNSASQVSGSALSQSARSGPGTQLQPGLAPWAKAGIIIEPDTSQGTAYAGVMVTGSHGVRMQYDYTHDSPGLAGPVSPSSPRWLRLSRDGDVITGYDSADGSHWTEIGSARLAGLPRTVQIGLFVTSPEYFPAGAEVGTPSVATASFDHVSARGDLPRRSWTPEAITASQYPFLPSASTWQERSPGAFAITGSGDIAPLVGDILSPQWAGASIVNGTIVALLFVMVLGGVFATSEYRRGLIRTTFAASPRRERVLLAKAAVAGSAAFAAGALATAIAEVITRHVLAASGSYLFPQGGLALARVITGTGLFLGFATALAVALGMMLRRSALTVAAGFVLLVLPGVLGSASGNWMMRFTPSAAFAIQATLPRSPVVASDYIPPNGYFPISPWAGLAVLAAYAAVAMGAAVWLVRRRDA